MSNVQINQNDSANFLEGIWGKLSVHNVFQWNLQDCGYLLFKKPK